MTRWRTISPDSGKTKFRAIAEGAVLVIRDPAEVERFRAWHQEETIRASARAVLADLDSRPEPPMPRPKVELRRVGGPVPIDLTAGALKAKPKPVTASSAKPAARFTPFLNVAPEPPGEIPAE